MDTKLSFFNYKRNRDKLFSNLISMIDGIICDSVVDKKELLYLDTWLLENSYLSDNYCIKTIKNKINSILADGVIEKDELEDFKKVLIEIQEQILDLPEIDFYSKESDKHLLDGLCKGVLANQELNEKEINYLHWWISQNSHLKSNFPGKEIFNFIKEIISDGVITQEEKQSLKELLITYTGADVDNGSVDGLSSLLPIQQINELNFHNANVCLTGKFLLGSRKECEKLIKEAGGYIKDDVTQNLDYLIIGTLSSRDWRFQSYGRKIEKAVEYRDDKKLPIKIISEDIWQSISNI